MKSRSAVHNGGLGLYFVWDYDANNFAAKNVVPAVLAQELGVLKPWEAVGEEA